MIPTLTTMAATTTTMRRPYANGATTLTILTPVLPTDITGRNGLRAAYLLAQAHGMATVGVMPVTMAVAIMADHATGTVTVDTAIAAAMATVDTVAAMEIAAVTVITAMVATTAAALTVAGSAEVA